MTAFHTDRLRVRHWAEERARPPRRALFEARLAEILTPPVLAPLPPPLHLGSGRDAVNRWMDRRDAEGDVRLVEDRQTGALLGLLILAEMPGDEERHEIRMGYLLAESAWGQGYATELVAGYVSSLEGALVLLVGGVGRDNPASARVLEKAGFRKDAARAGPGTDVYVLQVGRGKRD